MVPSGGGTTGVFNKLLLPLPALLLCFTLAAEVYKTVVMVVPGGGVRMRVGAP